MLLSYIIALLFVPYISASVVFTLGSSRTEPLSNGGQCDKVPQHFQFSQLVRNDAGVDCIIYEQDDCTGKSTVVPAHMEIVNIQRAESVKC
jgi:hypothetical protein